jgi:hypothetical protein
MATYQPTDEQIAALAKAGKCSVKAFNSPEGRAALETIVAAALAAQKPAGKPQELGKATRHHPASCWRCGGTEWAFHQHQQTQVVTNCIRCGVKCVTPKA